MDLTLGGTTDRLSIDRCGGRMFPTLKKEAFKQKDVVEEHPHVKKRSVRPKKPPVRRFFCL
jgi:hypothetical protein